LTGKEKENTRIQEYKGKRKEDRRRQKKDIKPNDNDIE